jgi:hypothetical protein
VPDACLQTKKFLGLLHEALRLSRTRYTVYFLLLVRYETSSMQPNATQRNEIQLYRIIASPFHQLYRFSASRRTSSALTRCDLGIHHISSSSNQKLLSCGNPRLIGRAVLTFPELLCGILAGNSFKDLSSTGVFIHEIRNVVDCFINYNVHALFRAIMGLHFLGADGFRHGCGGRETLLRCNCMLV